MALKIGDLFAALRLDSGQFDKALDESEKKTENLSGKLGSLGTKLTTYVSGPLMAAGGAALKFTSKLADQAEQLANQSAETGLSRQRLQELKFVAEQGGMSFDALAGSSTMLQRKLMGIEEGQGQAAEAMKRLGVAIKDGSGNMRSMDSLLPEVFKKLQAIENPTLRNAMASQLFGRSFGELAPVLSMTNEEFAGVIKQANETGNVLSEKALKAADNFDKKLDDLSAKLSGYGTKMISAFLQMPEWVQKASVVLMGLGVVSGPILKVVSAISAVRESTIAAALAARLSSISFTGLWAAITGPIGIVIAVVAAVAFAAWQIYKHWDPIKKFFINLWDAVKVTVIVFFHWLWDMFMQYSLYGLIVRNWGAIVEFVGTLWDQVYDVTIGRLGRVINWIREKLAAVAGFFADLYDKVVGHSYVPDMVGEVQVQFERLPRRAMYDPVKKAVTMADAKFKTLRFPGPVRKAIGARPVVSGLGGSTNAASSMSREGSSSASSKIISLLTQQLACLKQMVPSKVQS